MSSDYANAAQTLLALKSKAANGVPWTDDEQAQIDGWLRKEGNVSVLAACCILASERPHADSGCLGIVRKAIKRGRLPAYVEMAIYEALIYVEARRFTLYFDELLSFIKGSIERRAINLDNTICLLGKLTRAGEGRALGLIKALAEDQNPEIRNSATLVLEAIETP
jgi:hypothetical protein